MSESRAKIGQPLVDLGHPRLGLLVQAGASAVEADIGALQEPALLRRQLQVRAVFVQHGDAAEQDRVHHDGVPVTGHPQRDLLVDLEDRRIGMGRHQVIEHRRDLGEQPAGALQRGDGVGKVGRCRVVGDRGDLGRVIHEGPLEGGQEMFRLDLVKGRRLMWRLPADQKGVLLCLRSCICCSF